MAVRDSALFSLLLLAATFAPGASALSSCQVVAGNTVGPGDSAVCSISEPTDLDAAFTNGLTTAAASVSLAGGSMSGSAGRIDAIGGAKFGAEIIQDFTITGPATSDPLLIGFGFSVGGAINKNCQFCEANLGGSYKIQNVTGPTLLLEASAASSTGTPGWTYNRSVFGPGASASDLHEIDATHVGGNLGFDARTVLGHTLRVTISLSGNAHLNDIGVGSNGISVDASNTSLFNFFLPAGYTLTAVGLPGAASFLTDPACSTRCRYRLRSGCSVARWRCVAVVGLGAVAVSTRRCGNPCAASWLQGVRPLSKMKTPSAPCGRARMPGSRSARTAS
ncbi:MAG: hypothetical protein QM756_29900 [Polyangiaceae bacterium]